MAKLIITAVTVGLVFLAVHLFSGVTINLNPDIRVKHYNEPAFEKFEPDPRALEPFPKFELNYAD